MNPSAISWFEIPVSDMERAIQFYQNVFQVQLHAFEAMGMHSAFFPFDMEKGGIGGALMKGEGYTPSHAGALAYLNGGDDLSDPLSRVVAEGGKVLLEKTPIGENGFMAYFEDTEGNRVGLHSWK